jgi:hypothetical protein
MRNLNQLLTLHAPECLHCSGSLAVILHHVEDVDLVFASLECTTSMCSTPGDLLPQAARRELEPLRGLIVHGTLRGGVDNPDAASGARRAAQI